MTHPALRGIPTGQRVIPVASDNLCGLDMQIPTLGHPFEHIGCSRCPVDLVSHARYARYDVAGGDFPVGLSSLRLLTIDFLSQARPLDGLHRVSPGLSGAALSPPGCIPWTLRPNGSPPAGTGSGDFLSFHHHASWRTFTCGSFNETNGGGLNRHPAGNYLSVTYRLSR
jgi:hypothetical protein